jgi:hypothetical protein
LECESPLSLLPPLPVSDDLLSEEDDELDESESDELSLFDELPLPSNLLPDPDP